LDEAFSIPIQGDYQRDRILELHEVQSNENDLDQSDRWSKCRKFNES